MPRQLIPITRARARLVGDTRIEPGYSKDFSAAQMRGWAADLDRLQRLPPAEVDRLRATPPDRLIPEEQRLRVAYDKFLAEPDRGIKGTLRDDGTVELQGGRHRTAYLLEQGVEPVPVWVTAADETKLGRLRAECERDARLDQTEMRRTDMPGPERAGRAPNPEGRPSSEGRPRDPRPLPEDAIRYAGRRAIDGATRGQRPARPDHPSERDERIQHMSRLIVEREVRTDEPER